MRSFPRFYPILDRACFGDADELYRAAQQLAGAGATLLQYRNKLETARRVLEDATELKRCVGNSVKLIMNDRADLCLAAGFDGVHLGQDDLTIQAARQVVGGSLLLGLSTHNPEQAKAADQTSADYIAIGPVFATVSKANPDPAIGLDGVRKARALTRKPLVAIGGITRANCVLVIEAGADAVAVISDITNEPGKSAEEFLRLLR